MEVEKQPRPLREVEEGIYRRDSRITASGQERYRVLVNTLYQRMMNDYNGPIARDIFRQAAETIYQDAFKHSKAPFGRQKAVYYSFNTATGVVEYAGAVYICQTPKDRIRADDLEAQARSRFNSDRKLSFTPKTRPSTVRELQRAVERQTFVQGVSADGDKAREYLNKRKRSESRRSELEMQKDPEVQRKREARAQKRELEQAKQIGSKRAVAALEEALRVKE